MHVDLFLFSQFLYILFFIEGGRGWGGGLRWTNVSHSATEELRN